ncbi:DUF1365 domain-containing protein [Rhizobium sp. 32-5/1]|uniref:DUF1365 domain-containing protein n=1 Tax=Rhizobium sp. 32-5/1 TaxID=3019602 RepID=UPI00240D46C3|nr:DUF1365 domain-containing protein [Rhizobium sp. 32-5/1]WEZ83456.1 DUF1365 domain-containing protein [Rhizobium sp. 32-5/1]
MQTNGPPSGEAAALYAGQVMHQRMKPMGHRFNYKVFSLLIDIDRLDEATRMSSLFSVNRFNLLSFHEKDHTGQDDQSLRSYADAVLLDAGVETPPVRILLACYPRILGRVFNPIAVYYAYNAQGAVIAMIYEVRNTFGERHTYVCPVGPGQTGPGGIRQECEKLFHVSPFVPMEMRYHFRMLPPGEKIRWRILETDAEGPLLAATFSGARLPLKTGQILRLVAKIPHLTIKIIAGIHWEALKLWLKGARYIPRPEAPEAVSIWKQDARVAAASANLPQALHDLGRPLRTSRLSDAALGDPAE